MLPSVTDATEAGAGFAALMAQARDEAHPPGAVDPEAPYGYRADGKTPKRGPGGRPARKSPSLEELKASRAEGAAPDGAPGQQADRAPEPPAKGRGRGRARGVTGPAPAAPPMPKAGVIATGMNRAYRTAGRIAQAMARPGSKGQRAGAALVEMTRKDAPDDLTVGEAWEHLAEANPRIRRVLLKLIGGGAVGELVQAHVPLLLVLFMPTGEDEAATVLARVAGAVLDTDEPAAGSPAPPAAGLTPEDIEQAMAFAQAMAARAANGTERDG